MAGDFIAPQELMAIRDQYLPVRFRTDENSRFESRQRNLERIANLLMHNLERCQQGPILYQLLQDIQASTNPGHRQMPCSLRHPNNLWDQTPQGQVRPILH